MIGAVLLEMDGVLAETAAMRREALVAALAAEGVALSAAEYDERCAGLPLPAAARSALALRGRASDETLGDLVRLRAERGFAALAARGVSLAPGAREFVEGAASRARFALVTRATRREADLVLALADARDLFEFVIAADDAPPKPAAAPYERALERLARRRPLPAPAVVALEDALAGVRSARAAGIACVAVGAVSPVVALEADAHVATLAGLTIDGLQRLLAREREGVR